MPPLLQALRPHQWVKNLFVAAPLVFGLRLTHTESALRTAIAVALFSAVAGCVYLLNDLVDIEKDRAHPKKRNRPLASGRLAPRTAKIFIVLCLPGALAAAYALEPMFAALAGTYFVLNLGYSLALKRIAYLDVTLIATFFLLRVLAGAYAVGVPASPWILASTFVLAMFVGFGKRAHELAQAEQPSKTRAALAAYNLRVLSWILYSLAATTAVVYALYVQSPHTIETFGTSDLVFTTPFPVIGILRFIYLVLNRPEAESPTEEMLRDPWFLLTVGSWCVGVGYVLYG